LHLVDGLFVLLVAQPVIAPVVEHPRMQEVLVDRGQLVAKRAVEMRNDVLVAFHHGPRLALPVGASFVRMMSANRNRLKGHSRRAPPGGRRRGGRMPRGGPAAGAPFSAASR